METMNQRLKTKKVKGIINTGFVGCEHEVEFTVEDDATESDINEYMWQAVYNYISVGWEIEE